MSACAYCGSELRGEFCAKCGMKNTVPMKAGMTALQSLFWMAVLGGLAILGTFVLYTMGVI